MSERETVMVKKVLVSIGLLSMLTVGVSASAWAAPNPNPSAPAHAGTACTNVLGRNPNTGPGGHISDTGGTHFFEVGVALCGLGG
jgi:hypothetical protein